MSKVEPSVADCSSPKGIESEADKNARNSLLRTIGNKR